MKNTDIVKDKLQIVKLLVKDLRVPEEKDGYCWKDGYSPARLERQIIEIRALLNDINKAISGRC